MPRAIDHDDTLLVAQLRLGDERALDALIVRYHPPLQAFVRRYVGSADAADDVLQEVFLRLWTARETINLRGSLRGYLYAVARNTAMNLIVNERARGRREGTVAEGYEPYVDNVSDALERAEFEVAVWRAVGELPERCREVFMLSRQHGLSYPEVAAALGISLSTVKTQMGRAMASLARRLAPFLTVVLTLHR